MIYHPSRTVWIAFASSVLLLAALVWAIRHRGDSDVLPPDVVTAVEAQKASRPATAESIAAARHEADVANAARIALDARARRLERAAMVQGRRADLLALEAAHAATARDSANAYRLAYAARTSERDSLLVLVDTLRLEVTLAEAEARANARGRDAADAGRIRADSVLDATVAAARAANCRVPLTFGLVHCMSRTKAAVVGVAVGVAGKVVYDAARDGRIKVSLPFTGASR